MAARKFLYTDVDGLYQESAGALETTDLASTANGKGASYIGIEDAGGYTSATTVEAALQELYTTVLNRGVVYTAGTTIAKGDAVFISADDTVSTMSTLTSGTRLIGLAFSAASTSDPVSISANDVVLSGVLSGATFGTVYYWNGTAISSTAPTASGSHVWEVGSAKNATDLHVDIRFVKVNA